MQYLPFFIAEKSGRGGTPLGEGPFLATVPGASASDEFVKGDARRLNVVIPGSSLRDAPE